MNPEHKKLILIDGNAMMHRAFHAIPPLRTSRGELINAVYGFSSMILTLLNEQKPHYIAVSFDLPGDTFRHVQYAEYKATRTSAPDEFYAQIPMIKDIVRAFNMPIFEVEGFEADDVLGTLSKKADELGNIHTYIVTGDMDTLQLVSETTHVLAPTSGLSKPKIYDRAAVLEKHSLTPEQVPDLKGLQGDSSDNIKGVAGIGPKTAKTLLEKYQTIENIYAHLDEITGTVHDKLAADKDSAFLSKSLATIVRDMPLDLDLEACRSHEYDTDRLRELFAHLEFKGLLAKLATFNNTSQATRIIENPAQSTLF